MLEYIEKLKQKPEHIRKRYAFGVSFAVSLVIFAGWIASYGFKDSGIVATKERALEKPISALTASAVGAYSDLKSLIFGSNEVKYSADNIEVTGGGQ